MFLQAFYKYICVFYCFFLPKLWNWIHIINFYNPIHLYFKCINESQKTHNQYCVLIGGWCFIFFLYGQNVSSPLLGMVWPSSCSHYSWYSLLLVSFCYKSSIANLPDVLLSVKPKWNRSWLLTAKALRDC